MMGLRTVLLEDRAHRESFERLLRQSLRARALQRAIDHACHEINNSLALIGTLLETAKLSCNQNTVNQKIGRVLDEVTDCARSVARLLSLAEEDTRDTEIVDICKVVSRSVALVRAASPPAFTIHELLSDEALPAETHLGSLEDALLQILIGARDTLPEGTALTVACLKTRESDSVHDCGPGHYVAVKVGQCSLDAPADAGSVPRKTCAAAAENTESTEGVGFDIRAIRKFATQSGGGLRLERSASGGNLLTLYLPMVRA